MMVHGNHDMPSDIDFLSAQYGEGVYNIHSYYKDFGNFVLFGMEARNSRPSASAIRE